ncbi:unnamed protein product [Brassica oleracea var. botrytis]
MVAPTLLKAAKIAGDRRKLHSRRTFTETSRLPLSSSIRGKLISAGYTSLSSISSTDLAREAEAFEILKMANQVTGSSSLVNVYNTGRLLRFSRLPTLSIFPKFSPLSALMNSSNLGSSSKPAFSSFSQSSRSGGRGRGNERDNDRRRPQGRGGGGGGRGGGGGNDRIDALGRLLTRILRHMATEMRLDMRGDGFVKVEDLLNLNLKTSANVQLKSHTVDEIREAVRRDNKQRFSLVEEDGELLIRANQGHSITTVESDKLLKPILSPEEAPVCVHGTYKKNLESILASGLKRMNRLHVHFSCGLPTDGEVISGMRRDVNVLIFLDIKKALEDTTQHNTSTWSTLSTEEELKSFRQWGSKTPGHPENFETPGVEVTTGLFLFLFQFLSEASLLCLLCLNLSQQCLNALAKTLPGFLGGSADLASSNMTLLKAFGDFQNATPEGRNLRFGVREHGMGAICNGVALHSPGFIPYCATFFVFTDYMRAAMRIAALSEAGVIYVMTHDSIAGAYKIAVARRNTPSVLALSRQKLPQLPGTSIENVERGGYILSDNSNGNRPDVILVGTGSELEIAAKAGEELRKEGKSVRVVSFVCWELFDEQPDAYKESVLPSDVSARVSIEAGSTFGWGKAVRRDNKQRFSLVEENGELLIRANQGHSITTVESEKLLKPILSPEEAPVCVHGTYRKNLESILASGLKRMNRLHVHFSCGLPTDGEVISGMRRDVNLLIFLDIKKALEDGIAFYISDNKVILTEGVDGVVPVDYFQKIESWPSRQPIPF